MTRSHLPKRVYLKHGAYYFVDASMKWHKLCREREGLPTMYRALATLTDKMTREGMMAEAVTEWLDDPRRKWSTQTRKTHEAMGQVIASAFREFHVRDVTAADIVEFLQPWVRDDKARMHNRYKTCLFQIMKVAELKGWRDGANPAHTVPGMATPGRQQIVTDTDIAKLKKCALIGKDGDKTESGPALVKMIDIALLTGQRIGDMLAMRWQDVTEAGLYVAQNKSGGRVRLLIEWSPALRAAIEACATGTDRIGHLIKTSTGSPYTYWGIRSAWVRTRERAGLEHLNIHDLRGRAGADMTDAHGKEAAQKLLGHKNLRMTEHYIENKTVKKVKPAG